MTHWIINAEEHHAQHPRTFSIPVAEARRSLTRGDIAKLLVETDDEAPPGRFEGATGERLWVYVLSVRDDGRYVGELSSSPLFITTLRLGDTVYFGPEHVIMIDRVACVVCDLPCPPFEAERDLHTLGWTTKPYPETPSVLLQVCPKCSPRRTAS